MFNTIKYPLTQGQPQQALHPQEVASSGFRRWLSGIFGSTLPRQWLGALVLAGVTAIIINLALALTAFNPQNQPTGYVAQDEVSNYSLKSGTETLYRPEYKKDYWGGNLFAYPIDGAGNVNTAAEWWTGGATTKIDAQDFNTGRYIATMKDDGTPIPFRYSSLSITQQGYLTTAILDFLRGNRSGEVQNGGTLRQRSSALGDIIHTRPYYIADATNPTIFIGANDGMLHAIDASTAGGGERWAYVPSMLLAKMKNLSVNPYVHDYFVDGQINIATILAGTKRILVGGLGGGGRGLYALDITGSAGLTAANEAAVASKVLWEITPTKVNYANPATANAYINLGYTYGTPTIAKVGGTDAVIIGNGYNDNASGDYAAYLFVINADTGQRISAIKAGANGAAASPNGLSTPIAVDTNSDGSVDVVFAGDLNGTLWKFTLATSTATALLTTSPAQPITSTPAVSVHPNGGYMINFTTGAMLTTADTTDTSVHYAYGVRDSATGSNIVTQTLTERVYGTLRVRRVTANAMTWANDKGWKVALPAGEKSVGEGAYVENERYYFTGHNPTVSYAVPNTTTVIRGENWLMELDYLSGGTKNQPFLDLNGDLLLNNSDRIKYIATDTLPTGAVVGDPILSTDGITVGKFLSNGVLSQPILVQLTTLNDTLFNSNPDVTIPVTTLERGVSGGHFDVDIFYGTLSGGAQATATITVGATGQTSGFPATLGGITVDGVTIVPALTTSDITNGTATATNAATIRGLVAGGYTATVSGSVVTVRAPAGASYNGKTFTILAGTSRVGSAATAPANGSLVITAVGRDKTISIRCGGTFVGSSGTFKSSNNNDPATRLTALRTSINNTTNGYTMSCTSGSPFTCAISAPPGVSACSGGFTVAPDISVSTNTGPSGGASATGWTNFAPALTGGTFSGGSDGTSGDTCSNGTAQCTSKGHVHEYDDVYDRTGVNYLDSSTITHDLANAITSTSTQFKVLAQNQYLSPAVKLHIGNASYLFNVDSGYVALKNYQTSATLDLATVPTYTRANVGSLAINMPVDSFDQKDWWGGVNGLPADVRVGLHPTQTGCVKTSSHAVYDGNMYQPVNPPVNPPAGVTADGNGTLGYSASTTQNTATGVRHNGALIIQVIKASTPNSAIELSVAGRPEYGWRVKSSFYSTYVLAEYTTFWHEKLGGQCYGAAGWTKLARKDTRTCGPSDTTTEKKCATPLPATNGTDPKLGRFGSGLTVTSTVTTVVGNVTTTTVTYSDASVVTIVKTENSNGTITIQTTIGGITTTEIVANAKGSVKSGGDERGLQAQTGRVSWHELIKE